MAAGKEPWSDPIRACPPCREGNHGLCLKGECPCCPVSSTVPATGPICSIGTGHDGLNTVVLRRRKSGKPILNHEGKPLLYQGVPMVEGVGEVVQRSIPATTVWYASDLLAVVQDYLFHHGPRNPAEVDLERRAKTLVAAILRPAVSE